MTIVRLHRLAIHDFQQAYRWYAKRNLRAAEQFRAAVLASVQKIRENPTLAPTDDFGERWIKARRYPYLLYYYLAPDGLAWVLAVAHGRAGRAIGVGGGLGLDCISRLPLASALLMMEETNLCGGGLVH